ncbi:MAG: hypothetical protein MUO89_04660 [Dehalococcoidia bacterium]|nr:hypothetical protein [Dehalococcoidia bacterium]
MRQWKLYLIVITGSFLLFFTTVAACSQPPATTEEQPASQRPAEFEVGPIAIEPPVVMVGDTVTVAATVNNTGDLAGIYNAVLLVDGQEAGRKDITIEPGSNQEVSFQLAKITADSHQLAIGSSSTVLTVYNWNPYTIRYDESDGAVTGIYVGGQNGHIVHFTPPARPFNIQKIRIYGFAKVRDTYEFDRNHITVRIWDKAGNNRLWSQDFPWRSFLGGSWLEIRVPNISVNDDFEVEVVTYSDPAGGDPIGFVLFGELPPETIGHAGGVSVFQPSGVTIPSVICIGLDYPQSYINSPSNRPETRSGYSYMGKLIDPGQGRLKGINWLIRVDGEGAAGN